MGFFLAYAADPGELVRLFFYDPESVLAEFVDDGFCRFLADALQDS